MILNAVFILSILGIQLIATKSIPVAQDKSQVNVFQDQSEILETVLNSQVIDKNQVEYQPDIGQNSAAYAEMKPLCHMAEKVVYEDVCEPYKETTCYTQNKEVCKDVMIKNCTSVIETNVERVCFDVIELRCSLVEDIHYQTLREFYQVQRCFFAKDRICDTIYVMDTTSQDDFQCIEVETPNCYMEEVVLDDVTCTDTIDFDCRKISPDEAESLPFLVTGRVFCARRPRKDCYNVPRMVNFERCQMDTYKYCEKLTNTIPMPFEEQNCHFEPKKICEIQDRTRVKKGKKYSYRTHCDEVPREVCDQIDKKVIEPVCSVEKRLQCSYQPKEYCEEKEKTNCYKDERIVMEEVCDTKLDTSFL